MQFRDTGCRAFAWDVPGNRRRGCSYPVRTSVQANAPGTAVFRSRREKPGKSSRTRSRHTGTVRGFRPLLKVVPPEGWRTGHRPPALDRQTQGRPLRDLPLSREAMDRFSGIGNRNGTRHRMAAPKTLSPSSKPRARPTDVAKRGPRRSLRGGSGISPSDDTCRSDHIRVLWNTG